MTLLSNLQLMSQYNQWINKKIYQTAQQLGTEAIERDMGAFFGSILGTLNHIYVADIIWLRRFANGDRQYHSLTQLPELSVLLIITSCGSNPRVTDFEPVFEPLPV